MAKKIHEIQLWDGKWHAMAFGSPPHLMECCGCGLVHTIEYKLENGRLYERWRVDKRGTAAAKKERQGPRVAPRVAKNKRRSRK